MRAKTFFYVCAGLFLLALSYHLGARNAGAQAPGNPAVGISTIYTTNGTSYLYVVTANGDVYSRSGATPWHHAGNVFTGGTPVQQESWGAMKSRYRGERGAAQPAQQDR